MHTPKRRWSTPLAAALVAAAALLAGCASAPTPADYAAEKPLLDLKQYFNGELVAHGLFTDRSGKVDDCLRAQTTVKVVVQRDFWQLLEVQTRHFCFLTFDSVNHNATRATKTVWGLSCAESVVRLVANANVKATLKRGKPGFKT